ncbi:MAG: hypothetical protein OXF84_08970, partial [Bacteroidetes bacterium]|nr:hypothetical protein [Bacteroidota bacterium]
TDRLPSFSCFTHLKNGSPSYSKRHIDGAVVQEINLIEIDPVEDMAHFLTQIIQTNNLSKVTDIANSPDVSLKHYGIQRACDSPDNFEFSSRAYPGRSSHTDMCVWDFRYPGLRRTGAVGYTSNVPGAIVMWNSSYRTWTQGSHAEAYTVFYKYQTAGGNTELYRLNYGDLPSGQVAISKVTVTTLKSRSWGRCSSEKTRSSTSYGETYARSSIGRCNRRGTMSTHTASLTNVLGLPADYKIY